MTSERMLALVLRWFLLALAVWVAAEIVPGIRLEGWQSTLIVAAILGLLNLYLRPLLTLLTLPLTILTLGLFIIVLNAILLGLTDWIANLFDADFNVADVWAAIFGAIVISLVNVLTGIFVKPERIARSLTGGY